MFSYGRAGGSVWTRGKAREARPAPETSIDWPLVYMPPSADAYYIALYQQRMLQEAYMRAAAAALPAVVTQLGYDTTTSRAIAASIRSQEMVKALSALAQMGVPPNQQMAMARAIVGEPNPPDTL